MKFSDQIRQAIARCGMTRYQISKATGVTESTLSRFMAGEHIRTSTLDILAEYLGWQLVVTKTRNGKGR